MLQAGSCAGGAKVYCVRSSSRVFVGSWPGQGWRGQLACGPSPLFVWPVAFPALVRVLWVCVFVVCKLVHYRVPPINPHAHRAQRSAAARARGVLSQTAHMMSTLPWAAGASVMGRPFRTLRARRVRHLHDAQTFSYPSLSLRTSLAP